MIWYKKTPFKKHLKGTDLIPKQNQTYTAKIENDLGYQKIRSLTIDFLDRLAMEPPVQAFELIYLALEILIC